MKTYLINRDEWTDREREIVENIENKKTSHDKPSPDTLKLIGGINVTLESLKSDIKYTSKAVDEQKESIKELSNEIKNLPEKLDCKYANKSVETEVKALKDKQEARAYEWLKYLITAIVGGAITYFLK